VVHESKKRRVEELVARCGGKCSANFSVSGPKMTTHVVADDKANPRVQSLLRGWAGEDAKEKRFAEMQIRDVYLPCWVQDCAERLQVLPPAPKYLLHAGDATATSFSKLIDRFGDSYTSHVTDTDLQLVRGPLLLRSLDPFSCQDI
jgi:hypothetical protein